jgi:hypothetical protein
MTWPLFLACKMQQTLASKRILPSSALEISTNGVSLPLHICRREHENYVGAVGTADSSWSMLPHATSLWAVGQLRYEFSAKRSALMTQVLVALFRSQAWVRRAENRPRPLISTSLQPTVLTNKREANTAKPRAAVTQHYIKNCCHSMIRVFKLTITMYMSASGLQSQSGRKTNCFA